METGNDCGSQDPAPALRCVVAIPVRNEAERIGACLNGSGRTARYRGKRAGRGGVLNNCTDATAHVVAALQPSLGIPVRMIERSYEGANAGWARREAMEAAQLGWRKAIPRTA